MNLFHHFISLCHLFSFINFSRYKTKMKRRKIRSASILSISFINKALQYWVNRDICEMSGKLIINLIHLKFSRTCLLWHLKILDPEARVALASSFNIENQGKIRTALIYKAIQYSSIHVLKGNLVERLIN